MKQILAVVFSGIVGGAVALGGVKYALDHEILSSGRTIQNSAEPRAVAVDSKYGPVSFDFTEAASKAMPAVVHIKSIESNKLAQQRYSNQSRNNPFRGFFGDDFMQYFEMEPQPRQGTGSGVILSKDGYIITNNHVVEFADNYEVTLYDKRKFNAKLVGNDPTTDIAVLKIESENLPFMAVGNSDNAKVGEWVLAVGNPFNLTSTVTAGIISAKERRIDVGRDRNGNSNGQIEAFIQTDAAVNPGNSGGALVDLDGKLIGINSAIQSPTGVFAGYSFAIPSNLAIKIADDIIQYGSYKRPYLGVQLHDMDSDIAKDLGISETQGVYVATIAKDSPASDAGILPNDVIVGMDDRKISSGPELQELLATKRAGETISLTINRSNKIKKIPVKLKSMDNM